jgi:hypothetical protein
MALWTRKRGGTFSSTSCFRSAAKPLLSLAANFSTKAVLSSKYRFRQGAKICSNQSKDAAIRPTVISARTAKEFVFSGVGTKVFASQQVLQSDAGAPNTAFHK